MIQIIKSCILKYLRNKKLMLFNLFFPVFLIIVIGSTLSNSFENRDNKDKENIDIIYLDNGSGYTKEVLETLKNTDFEYKLNFIEEKSEKIAKQKVRVSNAVFLHLDGKNIKFYSNDKFIMDGSVVYGALKGITNGFNANIEILKLDSSLMGGIETNGEDEVFNIEKISNTKTPSSIDYYGVAELGLMIFYFFSLPMDYLKSEKNNNIKDRIKLSGVSSQNYYIGTFLGCSLVAFGSICISYLIIKFTIGVNYGDNPILVPLAAFPFSTLVIALGILLTLILKDEERADTFINAVIIPVLSFLGGGYIAMLDNLSPALEVVSKISPLRWFNNGLFRYIYNGDGSVLLKWVILGSLITLAMLIIIYFIGRKEELNNG